MTTGRLVFLHGFTQTHHHWHDVARRIAAALEPPPIVTFVDLPGHGLAAEDSSTFEETAARLADLAGPGTYVGYSMGGRVALAAAVRGHRSIERLVLIGATAGLVDPADRAERIAADRARADHLDAVGVDEFLQEWLASPLFATLPSDAADLTHRRRNTSHGLGHSLRTAGTGQQPSLWADLPSLRIPVLVIAGELDTKFTEIGRRMADAIPGATFASISDAGHAAHSERPELAAALIATWIAET